MCRLSLTCPPPSAALMPPSPRGESASERRAHTARAPPPTDCCGVQLASARWQCGELSPPPFPLPSTQKRCQHPKAAASARWPLPATSSRIIHPLPLHARDAEASRRSCSLRAQPRPSPTHTLRPPRQTTALRGYHDPTRSLQPQDICLREVALDEVPTRATRP